jgi:hypothetical protein
MRNNYEETGSSIRNRWLLAQAIQYCHQAKQFILPPHNLSQAKIGNLRCL